MNTVEVRLELRLPQEIYDFLQEESRLKKLSFEGLVLLYVRERLQQRRAGQGGPALGLPRRMEIGGGHDDRVGPLSPARQVAVHRHVPEADDRAPEPPSLGHGA